MSSGELQQLASRSLNIQTRLLFFLSIPLHLEHVKMNDKYDARRLYRSGRSRSRSHSQSPSCKYHSPSRYSPVYRSRMADSVKGERHVRTDTYHPTTNPPQEVPSGPTAQSQVSPSRFYLAEKHSVDKVLEGVPEPVLHMLKTSPFHLSDHDLCQLKLSALSRGLGSSFSTCQVLEIYLRWLTLQRLAKTSNINSGWDSVVTSWAKALKLRGFTSKEILDKLDKLRESSHTKDPTGPGGRRYIPSHVHLHRVWLSEPATQTPTISQLYFPRQSSLKDSPTVMYPNSLVSVSGDSSKRGGRPRAKSTMSDDSFPTKDKMPSVEELSKMPNDFHKDHGTEMFVHCKSCGQIGM